MIHAQSARRDSKGGAQSSKELNVDDLAKKLFEWLNPQGQQVYLAIYSCTHNETMYGIGFAWEIIIQMSIHELELDSYNGVDILRNGEIMTQPNVDIQG